MRLAASSLAVTFGLALGAMPLVARAGGGTPAGTSIVNQASSTYTDSANNNYTSTSNKLTSIVQNAPSVSFTAGAVQATVPGGQLTDTFTLTNTGNAAATFVLTNSGTTGSDATSQGIAAYVVTLPAAYSGGVLPLGCTEIGSTDGYSCTTLLSANALLANSSEAPGNVVTVGVVYNVATTATPGSLAAPNTIVTNLSVTSTQAAGTGLLSTTSNGVAAADTDDVVTDARIDVQKYGVQPNTAASGGNPANTTANIEYVVASADGGGVGARDLQSVKALLGTSAAGVFFSDKIPTFTPGGTTTPVLAAIQSAAVTTSAANGFGASSTATIYYTSVAGGGSGWTAYTGGTFPTTVTYIGVFVSGTPSAEYATNANGTSTGVVPIAKSAVTLTFYVAPPTGTGSANVNAYLNSADAVNGGGYANLNPDANVANPPTDVVGPGIATGTPDSTSAATIDTVGSGIQYPTGLTVGASSATDSSNTVGNEASVTGSVLNGPFGNPGATGSYNGSVAVSNQADYTAVGFTPAGFTPTNGSPTSVSGNSLTTAATVSVENTLQNVGNALDNITLAVTAPTGFGVQIYDATGTILLAGTTTNTATYTFANVPSGAPTDTLNQVNYVVKYTVPAGANATAFTPYTASLVATSATTGNPSNATYNVLLLGGPIALEKNVSYDTTTCPGGNAVPGCIMTYTITYVNNGTPSPSTCAAVPGTIPAYEAGYFAKNLVITENGTVAPNTWGGTYVDASGTHTNTTGLNAAATDTNASSTFTGNTAGSFSFTDAVGGAGYVIGPGCQGTLTFKVTVNTQ